MEAEKYVKRTQKGQFICTWPGCTHKEEGWTSKANATRHINVTHLQDSANDYACNYCDHHESVHGVVQTHQLVHSSETEFGCPGCNMTWYTRDGYRERFHDKFCINRAQGEHQGNRLEGRTWKKVGNTIVATLTPAAARHLVEPLDSTPFDFKIVIREDPFTPQARRSREGNNWLDSSQKLLQDLSKFRRDGEPLPMTSLNVLEPK